MLSKATATKITDVIDVALLALFNNPGVKMPSKTKSNRMNAAWEYWLSKRVLDLASARHKSAKDAAIAAEIIFDTAKHLEPEKFQGQWYADDNVLVYLKVNAASQSIKPDLLVAFLKDNGVATDLLTRAVQAATVKSRPAQAFSASLVTHPDTKGDNA